MTRILLALPILFAGCDRSTPPPHEHHHDHGGMPSVASKAKDVICQMEVDRTTAKKAEFDKADYFFCSDDCLKKFQAAPATYAKACSCATTMKICDCGHCSGKREPCDCGSGKK